MLNPADALARLDTAATADAELPAASKCLFVAAVHAAADRADDCRRWLDRARSAGATAERIEAAAVGLLLSRGEPAARHFGLPAATGGTDTPIEEIREYFEGVFGTVPPRIELLIEHHHGALQAYYALRAAGLGDNALGARDSELMLVAVNAAQYQTEFATIHARFARQRGATDAQLVETGACIIAAAGVAAWLPISEAILNSKEG